MLAQFGNTVAINEIFGKIAKGFTSNLSAKLGHAAQTVLCLIVRRIHSPGVSSLVERLSR